MPRQCGLLDWELWGFPQVLLADLLRHRPKCGEVLKDALANGGFGVSDFSGVLGLLMRMSCFWHRSVGSDLQALPSHDRFHFASTLSF